MMVAGALLLAFYAFCLRAAAGGLVAVDPSRLAPQRGEPGADGGFSSPRSLERAVAAGEMGSALAAAAAVALMTEAGYLAGHWPGAAGVLAATLVLAYPALELLPMLYQVPRGGRRLMLGIFIFAPLARPLGWIRTAMLWLIEVAIPGIGPQPAEVMAVRREAAAALSDEARDVKTLREAQKQLVSQVYEFGESTVEEVMVARSTVVGIPAEATVGEAVAIAEENRYSRYPVYRGTLDQVDGIIHIFDLLAAQDLESPVTPHMRPITFAPAGKKCDELLSELQKSYQHAAVVVDEFGGTAGWVTVEDLLEELVGDISDEHDVEEEMVKSLGRRSWLVDATMRVDDLNRTLGLELPEGDYETLAGFLLEELDRIPKRGEKLDFDGIRFEVTQAEPRRILRVKLETPA